MSDRTSNAADAALDLEEIRYLSLPESPTQIGDAVLSLTEIQEFLGVAVSFYGRWKDRQQLQRISRFMMLVSRRLDGQAEFNRDTLRRDAFTRDLEVALEEVETRKGWDKRAYYVEMLVSLWAEDPPLPDAERDRMIDRLSALSLSNLRMLAAINQMDRLPSQLDGQQNVNLPIVLQALLHGGADDLIKMDWDELEQAGIVNNWNNAMVHTVAFDNFNSFITPFGKRFSRYLAGSDKVEQ